MELAYPAAYTSQIEMVQPRSNATRLPAAPANVRDAYLYNARAQAGCRDSTARLAPPPQACHRVHLISAGAASRSLLRSCHPAKSGQDRPAYLAHPVLASRTRTSSSPPPATCKLPPTTSAPSNPALLCHPHLRPLLTDAQLLQRPRFCHLSAPPNIYLSNLTLIKQHGG